jgi:hypothetical protein
LDETTVIVATVSSLLTLCVAKLAYLVIKKVVMAIAHRYPVGFVARLLNRTKGEDSEDLTRAEEVITTCLSSRTCEELG